MQPHVDVSSKCKVLFGLLAAKVWKAPGESSPGLPEITTELWDFIPSAQ